MAPKEYTLEQQAILDMRWNSAMYLGHKRPAKNVCINIALAMSAVGPEV